MNPTNIEGLNQPKVKHILHDLLIEQFLPVRLRGCNGEDSDTIFNGFVAITSEAIYFHAWPDLIMEMPLNTPAEVIAQHGEERISALYAPDIRYPAVMYWEPRWENGLVFERKISLEKASVALRKYKDGEEEPAGTLTEQMEEFRQARPESAFKTFHLSTDRLALNGFIIYIPGNTVIIHTDGYSEMTSQDGEGQTVLFEYHWGLLRLHIWDNINTEDPSEYILGKDNYVIYSQQETEQDKDMAVILWSNKQGWVSHEGATIFAPAVVAETKHNLPMGDARWMKVGELTELLDQKAEAREREYQRRWDAEHKSVRKTGINLQPLVDALDQVKAGVHQAVSGDEQLAEAITLEDVYVAIAEHDNVPDVEMNVEVDSISAVSILEALGVADVRGMVQNASRRTFTASDLYEMIQGAQRAG